MRRASLGLTTVPLVILPLASVLCCTSVTLAGCMVALFLFAHELQFYLTPNVVTEVRPAEYVSIQ